MESRWRSWLREPLIHFLLIGLLLFLVLGRSGSGHPEGYSIRVDDDQIARIAANWERTWQRPPSAEELDRLIDGYVREEIYFREALRLGLDEDDIVIRRRLRSKMEFLARASVESEAPDDSVLQQWLDDHPEIYAADAVMTFDQIYLGEDGEEADIRAALENGVDPQQLGAATRLPFTMTDAGRSAVERQFGEAFAGAIDADGIGEWQGPVRSGFGAHLVRLRAYDAGQAPTLADVRQRVENDWRDATAAQREEEAFALLRSAYSVEIEGRD